MADTPDRTTDDIEAAIDMGLDHRGLRAAWEAQADANDIRAQAASAVTKFKVPNKIFFLDDLPKSGIGKILKRELREQFKDS